jgi:ATP-dependent Clp protease adaptor protein ClpS
MAAIYFSTVTTDPDLIEEVITSDTDDTLWKVIAHDDDRTTMEFVVRLLLQVFKKPLILAEAIMWQVHNEGMSVVDALPKKDAESRVRIATLMARMEGFPFRLTIEPND